MLALWQWLLAANQPAEKHGRILFHLALGSLCMAFVAGCRPQMVLFAALCLPIFWQRYLREKRLFTKQGHHRGRCLCAARGAGRHRTDVVQRRPVRFAF